MTRRLNIGMPIETAVWLTGAETEYQLLRWRQECEAELGRLALEQGILLTETTWAEKRPGEDRVPKVPAHITGPNVRLLVCQACVAGAAKAEIVRATGFVADLEKRDLDRLRAITRRAHRKAGGQPLSDADCDAIIEEIGPTSAVRTLRGAVDSKAIN